MNDDRVASDAPAVEPTWVDATGHDDQALPRFYVQRFRPEFQPAFDAWLARSP